MEDERLAQIEKAKLEAINQSNNTFNQMNQDNQTMLDQNINYAEQFEKTQNETLDKQLDFYKQNIDKQKQDAQKNYETEALRAENDFVSYTNPYGYQAEMMASKGQLQSGISQTAQLGGYNAYQNRLATANKAMQDAFTQYDLDMNEAIINNDVQKAQNALAKLEMILGYQQNFYDTKNQIAQSQLSNNQALDESYYGRYMDMINQINTEKQREEAIRQFEAQLAYQKERDKVADAQWEKQYELSKKETNYRTSGGDSPRVEELIGDNPEITSGNWFSNMVNTVKNTAKFALENATGKKVQSDPKLYSSVLSSAKTLYKTTPGGKKAKEEILLNYLARQSLSDSEAAEIFDKIVG